METNNLLKTVRQFDNESNDTFKFRINYIESALCALRTSADSLFIIKH